MELHQLRYFLAVAETGGFVRAARRCGVTQPSLSQQIRKLEGELRVTLFDRSSRGAVPTEAGHALLPRAQRILAEVRETMTGVREDVEAGRGPLSVGATVMIGPGSPEGVSQRDFLPRPPHEDDHTARPGKRRKCSSTRTRNMATPACVSA